MPNLKSISIPEPCHQSWQQMTPEANGRHCEQCSKVVTDFTKMSNSEIIAYLSTTSQVCGRIEPYQMNSINSQLLITDKPVAGRLRGWAMAMALFGSMASLKATAQTGAAKAQTTADSQWVRGDGATIGKIAMPQYREIRGQVIDNTDNSPVPGTRIFANNNLSTITDANGNFKLDVPLSVSQFTVTFVGYESQVIHIDPAKTVYPIKIKEVGMMLGEVVMVMPMKKPQFFKRVYYKFIKKPIHKVFR